MTSFKDFFLDKKSFYITPEETINLRVLSTLARQKNGVISIITNQAGSSGLAVVKAKALEEGKVGNGDLLSNVMTGKNSRIKQIYKWLGTIDHVKHFEPLETKEKLSRPKPKFPLIRKIADKVEDIKDGI